MTQSHFSLIMIWFDCNIVHVVFLLWVVARMAPFYITNRIHLKYQGERNRRLPLRPIPNPPPDSWPSPHGESRAYHTSFIESQWVGLMILSQMRQFTSRIKCSSYWIISMVIPTWTNFQEFAMLAPDRFFSEQAIWSRSALDSISGDSASNDIHSFRQGFAQISVEHMLGLNSREDSAPMNDGNIWPALQFADITGLAIECSGQNSI
jgi:hypothetical protein